MWWMLAQVGLKAATGIMQAKAQDKLSKEQNKVIAQKLGEQFSQYNMQQAALRRQTSAAMFNLDVQKQNALAGVGLQAAASDTVGASVQDAVSTVNVVLDRQEAGIMQEYKQAGENALNQYISASSQLGSQITGRSAVADTLNNLGVSIAGDITSNYLNKQDTGISADNWKEYTKSNITKRLGIK